MHLNLGVLVYWNLRLTHLREVADKVLRFWHVVVVLCFIRVVFTTWLRNMDRQFGSLLLVLFLRGEPFAIGYLKVEHVPFSLRDCSVKVFAVS